MGAKYFFPVLTLRVLLTRHVVSPGCASPFSEQAKAVKWSLRGYNMFITGAGGVGKSFVLDLMLRILRAHGKRVVVRARTV